MRNTKIIVTGANGQLGKELQVISIRYPEVEFVFLTREELPIDNAKIIRDKFSSIRPRYCINCAAYTAVDKAETESEKAFLINGEAPGILASICKELDIRFIHISTDYVFNGNSKKPYREDDEVDPVNTYGASKLQGEQLALSRNNSTIIIRTSWVYSEFGNNFVKTMMRLMKERSSLGVVSDQFGSPTYAADLAKAILDIIVSNEWKPGIFHYSNEGVISWFEFAKAINEIGGTVCVVNPIATAAYPTPAKRPAYSGFDKERIKNMYDITILAWRDSLEICIKKLKC